MMNDFITWSGWAFSLISTVIAIVQYFKKEGYKKQVNQLKTKISNESYNASDKGIAMRTNTGDITIN